MKKTMIYIMLVLCIFGLCGCNPASEPEGIVETKVDAVIDYGASEIYTKKDMGDAIEVIKSEFGRWKGFEVHTISYTSDEECINYQKDIEWLNEKAEKRGLKGYFTRCIMFKSDFHTPKNAVEGFSDEMEYHDWNWILIRETNGEWKLLDCGY